jgi:hypothetical protein
MRAFRGIVVGKEEALDVFVLASLCFFVERGSMRIRKRLACVGEIVEGEQSGVIEGGGCAAQGE